MTYYVTTGKKSIRSTFQVRIKYEISTGKA